MTGWTIALGALAYLLSLFVIAAWGDRRAAREKALGRPRRARPVIYALTLGIYCTSWTFFGSVGMASSSGLDFLAVYVGPALLVTLGYPLFSHVVRVAKEQRITSVADFVAARYGKSTVVGAVAAIIAVLGTVPYLALQLKAISTSVAAMAQASQPGLMVPPDGAFGSGAGLALWVAMTLALFAILFGTRQADATEHQDGLMLAVAAESVVKLAAFLAVGLFVTFGLNDGLFDLVGRAAQSAFAAAIFSAPIQPANFAVVTALSMLAFLLLPRQFHVTVVENTDESETRAARWMFPLYLLLINLFVVPVALAGILQMGSSVNPDLYVLALPLEAQRPLLTFAVFLGGLSAATAMVIVATIALAVMISNNLALPLMLRGQEVATLALPGSPTVPARDMAPVVLRIRRIAIFAVVAMAYGYTQVSGDSAALASIGLLSFAAIAQLAPAFFLGLVWQRGTAAGALVGMVAGFATWAYTLFIPTLLAADAPLLVQGPYGLDWLRPQALFGIEAVPLNHGVIASLAVNALAYGLVSLVRKPRGLERVQAATFALRGAPSGLMSGRPARRVTLAELKATVTNYMGYERTQRAFDLLESGGASDTGVGEGERRLATPQALTQAETMLASAIGAASARLVLSLLLQRHQLAAPRTMRLLDDASEALQRNRDLLQTALDQVDQGISVFDASFGLSSWNRQFRELLGLDETFGRAGLPLPEVARALHPDLARCAFRDADRLTERLAQTGDPFQLVIDRGGSARVLEVQTKPLPTGGIVISWNEITARVDAAHELEQANELLESRVQERTEALVAANVALAQAREVAEAANIGKTRFLAAVGHDILQPLNAARLYASSLSEQLGDRPQRALAGHVNDALDSVEDILGAVLEISRLDSGAHVPALATVPIGPLFERLRGEFAPVAAQKGVRLNVRNCELGTRSDPALLRRLLQNLVSNAIKYTERGRVTLDAQVRGDRIVFSVSDTGAGIDERDRETIFREFARLDAGRSLAPGLGLGLSIVQRLAAVLDHEVTVESRVGYGSVFTVAAPLVVEFAVEPIPPQVRSAGKLPPLQVACLDNEERIRDGMTHLLTGWGVEVRTYPHTDALLASMRDRTPDVVLADYHLDEGTGLEAIARLRSMAGSVPAVLLTADRSPEVHETAHRAGVSVLTKPVKPAALRAYLSTLTPRVRS